MVIRILNASTELSCCQHSLICHTVLDVWNGVKMASHRFWFHFREEKSVCRCQIWRVMGAVKNSNAARNLQPLGPPVLQSMHAVQSAGKAPPPRIFNDNLLYSILADVKLIHYHLKWQVTILQQQLPNLFDVAFCSRLKRGDKCWGCLEYLTTLHETIHTSKKCWMALLPHLIRLHTPFQQFLLQFYWI